MALPLTLQSRSLIRRATPLSLLATCALAIAASAATAEGKAAPELGVWLDHTGQGAVEIVRCGNRLCGHIVWLKQPNSPQGKPLVDIYNPDPGKRKRSICGLPVLGNLQKQAGGSWDAGWVYDPKDGKSYDFAIQSEGKDRLTVTGYMGSKFFGKSMNWTRAPSSLQRCGAIARGEVASKDPAEQPARKAHAPAVEPARAAAAGGHSAASKPIAHEGAAPSRQTPHSSIQTAVGAPQSGPPAGNPPVAVREAAAGAGSATVPSGGRTAGPVETATMTSDEPILVAGPVRARPPSARKSPDSADGPPPPNN